MLENDVVHFVHNDVMFAIKNVPLGTRREQKELRSGLNFKAAFWLTQKFRAPPAVDLNPHKLMPTRT